MADSFEHLVRQHQAMVFSLACYFLHDRATAEEVAQDVFLQLHRALGSLQSPEHVVHWLRRVTAHRCIDAARSQPRGEIALDDAPEPHAPAVEDDPLLSGRLRRLVASLPPAQRMIVILRFQEDLGPAEIADVMAMPLATVKSHLQRALALLREKMQRELGVVPR